MFNLPDLWERLERANISTKPFSQLSKDEVEKLCECVISSVDTAKVPVYGWAVPTIDRHGKLHIPFDSHPKYHWWKSGGQSVAATLVELDASWEVARPYIQGYEKNRNEEEWNEYKRKLCATD